MKLSSGSAAESISASAIILSGSARSGTTIFGKLIASCENIDYAFEPPTINALIASINEIPRDVWDLLYETYVFEEVFVACRSGRGLNTNWLDDSSAYSYLEESIINASLGQSLRRGEAEKLALSGLFRASYKLPDIVRYLDLVRDRYPASQIVLMRRKIAPTMHSLLQKRWFSDSTDGDASSQCFPFYQSQVSGKNKCNIPFWVYSEDREWWTESDEFQRCLYYYFLNTPTSKSNYYIVDYEDLLASPQKVFEKCCEYLNIKPGKMTGAALKTIAHQRSTLSDPNLVSRLSTLSSEINRLPSSVKKIVEELDYSFI